MILNPIGQVHLVNQVQFQQQELSKANAEIQFLRNENASLKTPVEQLTQALQQIREAKEVELDTLALLNQSKSKRKHGNAIERRSSTRKSRRLSNMGKELLKNNSFESSFEDLYEAENEIVDDISTSLTGRPYSKSYQEYLEYYI